MTLKLETSLQMNCHFSKQLKIMINVNTILKKQMNLGPS